MNILISDTLKKNSVINNDKSHHIPNAPQKSSPSGYFTAYMPIILYHPFEQDENISKIWYDQLKGGGMRFKYLLLIFVSISLIASCGGGSSIPGTCDATKYIPFNYTLESDHVVIQAEGGSLKVAINPFAAYALPHTGHAGGKSSSDWNGLWAMDYNDLTYLGGGDGSAPCNEGDICGIPEANINAYNPNYIAPYDDFEITSVVMYEETTVYYNTVEHWIVSAKLCGGFYKYNMGHMANIAENLRNKMVAAGYTDPWGGNYEIGENLITGSAINLSAGEKIGQPQVQAEEIGEYPGYLKGPGSIPESPMAQIEYSIDRHDGTRINRYSLESETDRAKFTAMITNEASTSPAFRYEQNYLHPWLWRAEMYLSQVDCVYCNNPPTDIFAMNQMGNWWEYDGPDCPAGGNMCNHVFVIHPIYKDSDFYDASYYHSSDVSYLAYKHTYGDSNSDRKGEVIYPASPDGVHDNMTIKWRLAGEAEEEIEIYQGLSYYLNNDTNILKISWGDTVDTKAEATHPSIPDADTVCDGSAVMCYTYWREGEGTHTDI